jgi:hypothetical protein
MGWYTKERRYTGIGLPIMVEMNFKLEGYNECLITYVMAVSSPTSNSCSRISKGWARNGAIGGASQYGIPVILIIMELRKCRPMFWSHYSYLGLDPSTLKDQYADYWALTQNHAKIMHQYSIANPKQWKGILIRFGV